MKWVLAAVLVLGAAAVASRLASGQPEGDPAGAVVTRVGDGDTIHVAIGGHDETVRLIGINTPETVDPRAPVECFGAEASARTHELLDGQAVWLERDAGPTG